MSMIDPLMQFVVAAGLGMKWWPGRQMGGEWQIGIFIKKNCFLFFWNNKSGSSII